MKKYNSRLVNLLDKLPNDLFITKTIFDNQIDAAKDILKSFTAHIGNKEDEDSAKNNHVILLAQMQGGKTGVCNSLVNIIEHGDKKIKSYFGIEDYYFITGMNDNGLHQQTYERCKEEIDFLKNIDKDKLGAYLISKYRQSRKDEYHKNVTNIFVYKNSDLKKNIKYIKNHKVENCIIFIDESHYGSNENHILTDWLDSNNINWKNNSDLKNRNIYIVSISATPLDEIISDIADSKEKIILKTTTDYYGVINFLNQDMIRSASNSDFNFDSKNNTYRIIEFIKNAHSKMINNKGLIFIRSSNRKEQMLINNDYIKDNFNCVHINSQNGRIDYKSINLPFKILMGSDTNSLCNDIDKKPILYLIKGAFRAGHTLDANIKEHTYMIYDYSINGCETTLQGLFGRFCGYRNKFLSNTIMYVNTNHIDEYYNWVVSNFQNDETPTGISQFQTVDDNEELCENEFYRIRPKGIENKSILLNDEQISELKTIHNLNKKIRREAVKDFVKYKLKYTDFHYMAKLQLWPKIGKEYATSTYEKLLYSFNEQNPYTLGIDTAYQKSELGKEFETDKDNLRKYENQKWIHVVLDERDNSVKIFKSITCIEKRVRNINTKYKSHKDTSK
jgi:hypothetical protein